MGCIDVCLGQHLARLEFNGVLRALTQRFPNATLADEWRVYDADAVSEVHHLVANLS
jgi:cytochrome P450